MLPALFSFPRSPSCSSDSHLRQGKPQRGHAGLKLTTRTACLSSQNKLNRVSRGLGASTQRFSHAALQTYLVWARRPCRGSTSIPSASKVQPQNHILTFSNSPEGTLRETSHCSWCLDMLGLLPKQLGQPHKSLPVFQGSEEEKHRRMIGAEAIEPAFSPQSALALAQSQAKPSF